MRYEKKMNAKRLPRALCLRQSPYGAQYSYTVMTPPMLSSVMV